MPRTRTSPRRTLQNNRLAVGLVTPAVILLVAFTLVPALYGFILSLKQVQVSGGLFGGTTSEHFVWFANYRAALSDAAFWHSIGRMLTVAVIGVPLTIVLATAFALCLDARGSKLSGAARLIIFIPYAVPGVIASLLWGFLYLPSTSPIGGATVDYFGSKAVFFSVANIAVWGVVGFNMVILYTAIRGLPSEIYDAAAVDGASELQLALRIKLPMVRPALTMVSIFSVLGALQLFNEPTVLKPLANAITSSWVPLMKVYDDAFVNNDIYQGAANALIIVAMTVGATLLVNLVGSRGRNR